jgi:hypothetical protein
MEGYLPRIKRFSDIEAVSEENFNTVIQQLQHNIDLLYNNMASSPQNWNVSELVFGNMMDFDSTGQKRFINGGRMDAIEKVLSFQSTQGILALEDNDQLVDISGNLITGTKWLRWDLDAGLQSNLVLSRSIQMPPPLRHQNILIAVKLCGFVDNQVGWTGNSTGAERFDIFVNGQHSGTGTSGIHVIGGKTHIKTIYATYSLTGVEKNLEIKILRSTVNAVVPSSYRIRMSNMFVGLNTTNTSSYLYNYPSSSTSFSGASADISSFYDFTNNAIVPIPRYLTDTQASLIGTSGSQTVNISVEQPTVQDTYYVSLDGSGNMSGTAIDNQMPASVFFDIDNFQTTKVYVHFEPSEQYISFTFDKGCYYVVDCEGDLTAQSLTITNGTVVKWNQTILVGESDEVILRFHSILVSGKSRWQVSTSDTSYRMKLYCTETLDIIEGSGIDAVVGIFGMPLDQDYHLYTFDHSYFNLTLMGGTSYRNSDSLFGFGCVVTPIYLEQYSNIDIDCQNADLSMHIAHSTGQAKATILKNHSRADIRGFNMLSTFADEPTFYGYSYCTFEVDCPIQTATPEAECATSFSLIHLEIFSSFGSQALEQSPTERLVESFIYVLDE